MNHPNLKEQISMLLWKAVTIEYCAACHVTILVTFIVKDYVTFVTCEFTWNDLWTSIQPVPAARFNIDFKTVGFFLKIRKKIGKVWRKSLAREAREPHTPSPVGRVRREKKKTDCPFSIQLVRSDQGVQKCRRAVKNLFTTSALFVNLIHSVIDFEGE